jgi:hypothetical protein
MAEILQPIFNAPTGFKIHPVLPTPGVQSTAEAPLGALAAFTGDWTGTGFNTIFRPNNPATPTFNPAPPGPSDNVLELNLTTESLSFSGSLGSVPNRALLPLQGDIQLNGVPYLQAVTDVTNGAPGTPIHLEPGLWMAIPATTAPKETQTFARMASIPHGTTVLAQGTATVINGAPVIPAIDITPLVVGAGGLPGNPVPPGTFPSMTAANGNTSRIPQNLAPFLAAETITQQMLDDPNSVLRKIAHAQNITSTTVISISTVPAEPLFGGGTPNIAFLDGNAAQTTPNAQTTLMSATFWIETVEHIIHIPIFRPGDAPLQLKPRPTVPGQPVPTFTGTPPGEIAGARTITVRSTQIQYSQVVMLKFNNLFWPHVSVATLVPAAAVPIPPTAWA